MKFFENFFNLKKNKNFFQSQKILNLFIDLRFAIIIFIIIAITSSIGSFIEQDESEIFYKENYSRPVYGFLDSQFILYLGLDHLYRTWWFIILLIFLSISLIACTFTRQFPLLKNSKDYFFKNFKVFKLVEIKQNQVYSFSFFSKLKNFYYLKELILLKITSFNYYLYQKKNVTYAYKGLLGRISPILVHISLLLLLFGACLGAIQNFKAQEIIPKGENIHIQNPIKVGFFTKIPKLNIRVNDFWIEYENKKIHQFYSNLSILNNCGKEYKEQTISVNNPLRYKNIDIYQSDWNLNAIRAYSFFQSKENKYLKEYPVYSLNKNNKLWITWIENANPVEKNQTNSLKQSYTLLFDKLEDSFLVYDDNGKYLRKQKLLEEKEFCVSEILSSTGLLIKYDPSIFIIYSAFFGLITTTFLSYLPYIQLWVICKKKASWLISYSNRGTIQFEIQFENIIREIEKIIFNSKYKIFKN
jgi:cytochrome c biogenesis protein